MYNGNASFKTSLLHLGDQAVSLGDGMSGAPTSATPAFKPSVKQTLISAVLKIPGEFDNL
jgi:hypothetical protein